VDGPVVKGGRLVLWLAPAAVAVATVTGASLLASRMVGAGVDAVVAAGVGAWAALLVPGVVSVAVVRGAWRRAYRWLVVAAIAWMVEQVFVPVVLVVGLTWLLHVTWVIDATGLRTPHMFTSRTKEEPDGRRH
jgi:hypothetical protein